ncbi:hypothetical protein AGMMS50230_20680 [Spirochaetia bacterium]|nr:hypothetical protein AGMMS50230_20680 [Spirochaetia bacterium]
MSEIPTYHSAWIERLDVILKMNGRELLTHAGKISHEMALGKSKQEYEKFRRLQIEAEKKQSLDEIEHDIKELKKK